MDNKISIIVPAYNIAQYLPQALESILAQTYSNIEVIVVNDGSQDSSGSIIDRYAEKDSRVKAVHKKNGGVTSARLRGIAEATGDWIGFVDGDDFIEPDMYERLLKNALQYQADISHCGYQMVFPDGHIDYYYNTGRLINQSHLQGCNDLLEGAFVEPGLWNKLYRIHLFRDILKCDTMPTDIRINEDLLMNYLLFKESASSVYEDVCLYHYVLRKGSAATSQLSHYKLTDPLKVLRMIMKDAPAPLQDTVLQRLTRQLISGATMNLCGQPEWVKPFRTESRQELCHLLGKIVKSRGGIKLKMMALWAAFWPASYGFVHQLYAKATGIDKKYEI